MSDLKPCPFCGGNPAKEVYHGSLEGFSTTIRCTLCNATVRGYNSEATCDNLWNTRSEATKASDQPVECTLPQDQDLDEIEMLIAAGQGSFTAETVKSLVMPLRESFKALYVIRGETPEAQQAFMVNWLRGNIVIPDEVCLRIWLSENEKRGLKPVMEG